MNDINIAGTILSKRRERGMTQDDLAVHIGVSKASVSKWETGQCFPDITILPQLAAFFGISIDELMGYRPQLSRDEIRVLYRELAEAFAKKPFEQVRERCRELVHRYYTCYPLLNQIGVLLVNHSMFAGGAEMAQEVLTEAMELFVRVKTECGDAVLAKQAQDMEALCLLSLNRPAEVTGMAEDPAMISQTSLEGLLVRAHQMLGETGQAKKIAQSAIYQHVSALTNMLVLYLGLCADDSEAADETIRRVDELIGTFDLEKLHPAIVLPYYLSAAQLCTGYGRKEQGLLFLERYTVTVTGDIYPMRLHGDGYFNLLDEWIEQSQALGADLPRDEQIVRQSMTEAVTGQPVFAVFEGEPRFLEIVRRLRRNEQKGKPEEAE